MRARIFSVLKSLLDIRPGEWRVALLMVLSLFLVISTFAVVKPVRSSLFLQHFGARNLPYVYLATALLAGAITWIHSKLLDRFNLLTVQVLAHLFFISNLILFWFAFRSDSPWLSAAFFLWVNVFTVTANALFWTFANHYYNAREAKRLYGFISAGGTLGGIASGFSVAAIAQDIGTDNMLLICCGVLGVYILLTRLVWRLGKERFAAAQISYVEATPQVSNLAGKEQERPPLRNLFQSAYPKYIAAAMGLSLIISTLIDYQFNVAVEGAYPDENAKTAFFSSFIAAVSALSFFMQIFLTSKLLRGLGIGFALMLLPVTLLGGSFWLAFYPVLSSAIFVKIADQSVRYSVEQSTRDVLYLPIPDRVMGKLKTFVDVFVQRFAKGIGSLLILALTVWWTLGFQILSYVAIVLALLWVTCSLLLRKEYREQLKNFLARENLVGEPKFVRVLDQITGAELLRVAESGNEEKALYSLELLAGSQDPKFVSALRKIVRQGSVRLKARALHLLAELGDTSMIDEAEHALNSQWTEVQEEAIHYLCASSQLGVKEKMKQFLMVEDPGLRAGALACMASCGGSEGEQMAHSLFEKMLAEKGEERVAARTLLARTLRHIKPPCFLHSHLRPLLQEASSEVVREALLTVRRILRRDFVPLVIEKLADPEVSPQALETLQAYGERVLGTLRDYMEDEATSIDIRRLLPAVFAKVGTDTAVRDLVASLYHHDARLRYEVIKALNKIRDRNPALKIDGNPVEGVLQEEIREAYGLLKELCLRTSVEPQDEGSEQQIAAIGRVAEDYRHSLERIFRLLGLLFSQRDIYTAYRGLNSPRLELKMNAVELLDNLLPSQFKRVLLPLVDDEVPVQEKLKVAEMLLREPAPAAAAKA
ncbi:MAG: hypothetical protein HY644_07910 [Acidobacteria bacterium]|nr:hypothetical protein [Acidobacteriota bacterium]